MILTDEGIILIRQNFREADRMVCLFTREHGRINLRFPSVNKALGKMKALSEPFVHANYRVYFKKGATIGCVTGGKLNTVFPAIRMDTARTKLALHFCELMFRLTPENQPSEEKFDFLLTSLRELQSAPVTPAISPAFILRLMTLAGFGMDKPALGISPAFWEHMHNTPLNELNFTTQEDILNVNKAAYICRRFLNRYLAYPLNTLKEDVLPDPQFDYPQNTSDLEPEAVVA
ncbi:DNA repair protein RecO (recombination protein O) [Elusimicrobium simillimum]|uniref:DNA repair protein RecO n=1 Tax=Elusimicrobium simillimum TaxID=3143438 RepID=UPI003C702FE5